MRTTMAGLRPRWIVALFALLLASVLAAGARDEGSDNTASPPEVLGRAAAVRLWDTGTPLGVSAGVVRRKGWQAVTAGASGRVRGDLVVETEALTAVFASGLGKVLLYTPGIRPGARPRCYPPNWMVGRR